MSMNCARPYPGQTQLAGYTIEDVVSEEGATRVARARRDADGQAVLLKMPAHAGGSRAVAASLKHEYQMTRRVDAPGVIRALALEEVDGLPALVLEDFGGESLADVIAHRRLGLEEALRIGIRLADALADVHAADIIHKDINPSNAVYNADTGVVKLIDFGSSTYLAREKVGVETPAVFEGSLPYVSPEQTGRMNRLVDYRTDFYSLGATLFELLVRRPVFMVTTSMEWFHCHIAKEPRTPSDIDPAIPRQVSDIVMRLLAKTAEERYQSARGIQADLQRCLDEILSEGRIAPFILGASDVRERFHLPQRLYGRDQEVERLLASFRRSSEGHSEFVFVSGYSGVGKTALVREIYKPITERHGYFISGKFDQLHGNVPYGGVVMPLRELIRQLLTESEQALDAWRTRLLDALGPNAGLITEMVGELELIIGPQPRVPALSPVEAEQRFQRTVHDMLQVVSDLDHPLVVFVDDMQWADSGSLKLLEMLAREAPVPHLLFIGAYRDNEVHAGHPLLIGLRKLREVEGAVDEIYLEPLCSEQIGCWLADAFDCDLQRVAPLAALVTDKTGGNPFFTEEFLKSLHQQGLIAFSRDKGVWEWDVERIHEQRITDNVVDLMAHKLDQLPVASREVLEFAACIGNRFQLGTLVAVADRPAATLIEGLRAAMTQGLIAPVGDASRLMELEQDREAGDASAAFTFAHDRIQHAAYSLLDEARRRETHHVIGTRLLALSGAVGHNEHLFEITNQLNLARDLIADAGERQRLCRLNLEAGKRAKAATAYQTAHDYFGMAIALLGAEPWKTDYELTLDIHTESAETAYLVADYDAMEPLLSAGLSGARTALDRVPLYLVRISAYVAQGRPRDAVDTALPVLAELGHRYPRRPTQGHVLLALGRVMWQLRGRDAETLRELPAMTDPHLLAATRVGERVGRAAMFVEPKLLTLMTMRGVRDSVRYGYTSGSLTALSVHGMIVASHLGKVEQGLAFGRVALDLADRLDSGQVRGRVMHIHNAMVRPWGEPLRETLDDLQDAYRICLEHGDFEFAALAVLVRVDHAFYSGMPLDQWLDVLHDAYETVKQLDQEPVLHILECFLQCAESLQGYASEPARLSGRYYDAARMLEAHVEAGDGGLVANNLNMQVQYHYHFGDVRDALHVLADAEGAQQAVEGFFLTVRQNMFASLVRLANVPGADRKTRRTLLRAVRRDQGKLKRWATGNPANFLNKFCLVDAEILRVSGRPFDAHARFDEAIELAHEQGFIHEEALASELCGRMHMEAGRRTLGQPYLARARNLYQAWGATGKVDDLQARFPQLVEATEPAASPNRTITEHAAETNTTALMQALRTIADESVHSRMVESIIVSAMEFAGAQHGLLMLRNAEGVLRIEAEASVDSATPRILQSLPVTTVNTPQRLLNYVTRTGQSFVIHDAQQPSDQVPGINRDPYIHKHGIRSVLCLPILGRIGEQQQLIGMLYLENNRATGTFTRERFDTLEIICIAAAGRLELSRKAAVDGLTQLYNHDYFQNVLAQEFAGARRNARNLALLLIDIDHFKHFNDTWGHQVGDEVLREVAATIKSVCRDEDTVARYGGEEMAVVLPGAGRIDAERAGERIRAAIEGLAIDHDDQTLAVTVSLGVALFDSATADPAALVRQADVALYRSKDDGRNRVTVA